MEIKFEYVWSEQEKDFFRISSFEDGGDGILCHCLFDDGREFMMNLKYLHDSIAGSYVLFYISCSEKLDILNPLISRFRDEGYYAIMNKEFEISDFDSLEAFEKKIGKIIKEHMVVE